MFGIGALSVLHRVGISESSPRLSFTLVLAALAIGIVLFLQLDFKDITVQLFCFLAYLTVEGSFLFCAWLLFDCLLNNSCFA